MTKRKAIGKKLRYAILARDSFTCRYCGAQPGDGVLLVVDHIHPVSKGGGNDPTNLITACTPCNSGKGARSPEGSAPTRMDRARLARELREQQEAARIVRRTLKARQDERQEYINLFCSIRGSRATDSRTVESLVRWARRFGVDALADWIGIAHGKFPGRSDYRVCRYIGGIARRIAKEEREWDEAIDDVLRMKASSPSA